MCDSVELATRPEKVTTQVNCLVTVSSVPVNCPVALVVAGFGRSADPTSVAVYVIFVLTGVVVVTVASVEVLEPPQAPTQASVANPYVTTSARFNMISPGSGGQRQQSPAIQ